MQICLYLQNAYEEYDNAHMCRGHWNYQWGGRGSSEIPKRSSSIKIREERFGGLIQNVDGKIYKIDKQAFEVIRRLKDKQSLDKISNEMNIDRNKLLNFINDLNFLDLKLNE